MLMDLAGGYAFSTGGNEAMKAKETTRSSKVSSKPSIYHLKATT